MNELTETPLRYCRGVGPVRSARLAACGLHTVWDALHHPSSCLGAAPAVCAEGALPAGEGVQVIARVLRVGRVRRFGRRSQMVVHLERDDGLPVKARFFNAGYLRDHLLRDEWYRFEGRVDRKRADTLNHPAFNHLPAGDGSGAFRTGCQVGYPGLATGISEEWFARLIDHLLDTALPQIGDPASELPDQDYQDLLRRFHRPADPTGHETARRSFAYRELLALAWLLRSRRRRAQSVGGRAWRWSDRLHARALARLPFALTPGQESACAEIRADARDRLPMYRLLQGDVGSGKTALALLAALAVVGERAQVLLLAPTAVLAEQHHRFCADCLAGSRVRLGLLTGGTAGTERRGLLAGMAAGSVDLLIGTHALLEEDVRVGELGLVVIDEQHKFGVDQRLALVRKASAGQGYQPDLLLLTATPIPRTMALSLFGDLAVSTIAGKPPGRGTVITEARPLSDIEVLTDAIVAALAAGGSAFVIVPLRQESAKVEAQDAETVYAHLRERFATAGVGLLHGAMPEPDKVRVLHAMRSGDMRVLVSTTVVEVGVDVSLANLMAVVNAERFGMAQLHQLRGRIGRGALAGRCLLLHRPGRGEDRIARLVENADGLAVAEADLAQRGPGEFLGTRQHGLPQLRLADLVRDADLLQEAHRRVLAAARAGEPMPRGISRLLPPDAREELLDGG